MKTSGGVLIQERLTLLKTAEWASERRAGAGHGSRRACATGARTVSLGWRRQ